MPAPARPARIVRAMPTPAERRALFFLSGLLLLGAGARTISARSSAQEPLTAADSAALQGQLQSVDSARARSKKPRTARSRKRKEEVKGPGVAPGMGISSDPVRREPIYISEAPSRPRRGSSPKPGGGAPVDLDRAGAAEIERLPRIGPVLARRIVADRDSLGPFGSLEGFGRVKGVGPALLRTVGPHVTFSLQPRQSPVDAGRGRRPAGRRRDRPARVRDP